GCHSARLSVLFFINLHTKVSKVFTDFFSHLSIVFAYTCSKCDCIYTVHCSCVGTDIFCHTVSVSVKCHDRTFISFVCCSSYITEIGRYPAHSENTGFLVQDVEHFVDIDILMVADKLQDSRIKVTASCSHDQSFKGCQTHTCINAFSADGS